MSEKAAERMRKILNGTGGYRLTGESSADWELNAGGSGLDGVQQAIDSLLEDLFALTASKARLDDWEKLFRPQPSAAGLENRRIMLRERLFMNPGRFTPGEFSPMLRAAGIAGEVVEENGRLRVLLGRCLGVPPEEAKRELDTILPAHLLWEWDDSVNWTALDAWAADFETLDSRGLTWEQLESATRENLEQWEQEEM